MARWTTRGSWIPTIPDPAPCFVKSGAGYAQQSYEKHSVVEPVRGGPHAGEAPELDMETLRNTRLDRSTGDQRRSEIRQVVRTNGAVSGAMSRPMSSFASPIITIVETIAPRTMQTATCQSHWRKTDSAMPAGAAASR